MGKSILFQSLEIPEIGTNHWELRTSTYRLVCMADKTRDDDKDSNQLSYAAFIELGDWTDPNRVDDPLANIKGEHFSDSRGLTPMHCLKGLEFPKLQKVQKKPYEAPKIIGTHKLGSEEELPHEVPAVMPALEPASEVVQKIVDQFKTDLAAVDSDPGIAIPNEGVIEYCELCNGAISKNHAKHTGYCLVIAKLEDRIKDLESFNWNLKEVLNALTNLGHSDSGDYQG